MKYLPLLTQTSASGYGLGLQVLVSPLLSNMLMGMQCDTPVQSLSYSLAWYSDGQCHTCASCSPPCRWVRQSHHMPGSAGPERAANERGIAIRLLGY
ncbi:hypothetical protein NEOLEDRAFT_271879 [Neolentinus lepideus HHB14362 ss-1]|uniref:Uncharacterized protein n=1 Tax=Neolentinus lepideus HHB14362 ss-1 TaxID=1314782 RepID=A0A165T4G4_9AGAM|nr:hypothetical protein NEOLEDRAFT_271879 [Neolentinus lepideus HHB14362 ss-1]